MEPPTEGKKVLSQVCLGRKVSRRSLPRAVGSNQKYKYMHGFRTAKNRYLKRGFLSQLGVIFQLRRLKSKSFNTQRGSSQYSEQARVIAEMKPFCVFQNSLKKRIATSIA